MSPFGQYQNKSYRHTTNHMGMQITTRITNQLAFTVAVLLQGSIHTDPCTVNLLSSCPSFVQDRKFKHNLQGNIDLACEKYLST